MKHLPPVGSIATVNNSGIKSSVKIVAHHNGYAVYVWYSNNEWHSRINPAEDFEFNPDEPETKQEQIVTCYYDTPHNFVQVDSDLGREAAFCTRCGKTITLE